MPGRIKKDPDVLLRLEGRQRRAASGRVRTVSLKVVNHDVQVHHHLLVARTGRPHRRDMVGLQLEGQASAATRIGQRHPVRLIGPHRPAEQLPDKRLPASARPVRQAPLLSASSPGGPSVPLRVSPVGRIRR